MSSGPPEIWVHAVIESFSLTFEKRITGLLDTGAGKSYLITPEKYAAQFPTECLSGSWTVRFADNTSRNITHRFKGYLTIIPMEEESPRVTKEVELLILPSTHQSTKLIIGRDLLEKFKIVTQGANKARIENAIIFERHRETPHIEGEDLLATINDTQSLITTLPHSIVKLLQNPLDEGSEDRDDYDEEVIVANKSHNQPELQITFLPEPDAPKGRAYISVPWISDKRPDINFEGTYARDKQVFSKLTHKNKELYLSAIKQLIEGKFAHRIPTSKPREGHFIGIRPVFDNTRATTKCRLCLDATGINRFTHPGPQKAVTITEILLSFRANKCVATFDLQKAFWMVRYYEHEKKYYSTVVNGTPIMFDCLIFGGNYSPAALEETLQQIQQRASNHIQSGTQDPDEPRKPEIRHLLWNHYVDDFLLTNEDPHVLHTLVEWSRWFLTQFGFQSNKLRFNNELSTDTHHSNFLGYKWYEDSDEISLKEATLPEVSLEITLTRKQLVKQILKFYDPTGISLRLQLAGRMILRESFTQKPHTDTNPKTIWKVPIDPDTSTKLSEWTHHVNTHINSAPKYPRFVNTQHILVFSDASTVAWAYTLVSDKDFTTLLSKGGLTQSNWSIPKAELHALYEAVAEVATLKLRALGTTQITFLTDNQPNVHRLRNIGNDRHLPIFEFNRVTKIRDLVAKLNQDGITTTIRTIPGVLNIADYPTRPWPITPDTHIIDMVALRDAVNQINPYEYTPAQQMEDMDTVLYMVLRSSHHTTRTEDVRETPAELARPQTIPQDPDQCTTLRGHKIIDATDRALITELITQAHGPQHYGRNVTAKILKCKYHWKNLRQDVTRFINECKTCSLVRIPKLVRTAIGDNAKWLATLEPLGMAAVLGIDACVMDECNDYTCFLTITCSVSKWIRTVPLTDQTSFSIIQGLQQCFLHSLFPKVVITDGAPSLKSREFNAWCIKWQMIHLTLPSYAATYHGWVERPHKQVLDVLRLLTLDYPTKNWSELLSLATHLVNTRPYEADDPLGLCPLHLIYNGPFTNPDEAAIKELLNQNGFAHLLPVDIETHRKLGERLRNRHKSMTTKYTQLFQKRRDETRRKLREYYRISEEQKFPLNSWVRVYRPSSSKIAPRYSEPRQIVAITSAATRTVRSPDGNMRTEYIANLVPVNDKAGHHEESHAQTTE